MFNVFHVAFGGNGQQVAVVDAPDLDKVYEVTNNITHAWIENPEIVAYKLQPGQDGIRSTSVDDIIFNVETKQFFIVSDFGFDEITMNSKKEVAMIVDGEWVGMPVSIILKNIIDQMVVAAKA